MRKLDTSIAQPLASKSLSKATKDRAVDELLFGTDDPPPGQSSRKRKRSAVVRNDQPADAVGLVDFLLQRRQLVGLKCEGVDLSFDACVHVDMETESPSLTMVLWGEGSMDVHLTSDMPVVAITLADGRVFAGVFVGAYVRLGLRGCIISFTLTSDN